MNVLCLIAFNVLSLTCGDNQNIQFKDSTVEKICIENWDTNGDGKLSVEEAESVTSLGKVFKGEPITEFTELRYFKNLHEIGDEAFSDCNELKSIIIPSYVKRIGYCAFKGCIGLTKISIPSTVKKIGEGAFSYCSQLEEFIFPWQDGESVIEESTFSHCYNLRKITIYDNITSIGVGAFAFCRNLSEIILPENVKQIKNEAFLGCNNLKRIKCCSETTPPILGKDVFRYQDTNYSEVNNKQIDVKIVVIGEEAANVYKSTPGWCDFKYLVVNW